MASAADAKAYNEALNYLKMYGVQSGQAAVGTDALMVLPGVPGALVRGTVAAGGVYHTGKGIAQVSDGKFAEGGINIALGSAAIFGGYVGNKVVGKPNGGIISPESKVIQESSLVLDKKTHTSIPKVEAELIDKELGKIFKDTNQGNRPDYLLGDKSRPTLINDRAEAKIKNPGKYLSNGNMASARAEVGTIQQAFEDGLTIGRDMNMRVTKEPVCGYCRGDIAAMADKAGLKSLTVYEGNTGKILYWNPGMKSLKEKIMLFSLSWTLNGIGGSCDNPLWNDVEIKVLALRNAYGTITLDIHDNETGPQMLQVRVEAGNYLVMLGEIVNDDYEVRTYYNKKSTTEMVCILGDYWPKNQIITDFSLVTQVVSDFFYTGNVQKKLLS